MPAPTCRILLVTSRLGSLTLLSALLFLAGCGRTPLLPPMCILRTDVPYLDFGEVEPGARSVRSVVAVNLGPGHCSVSAPAMAAGSDPSFTIAGVPPSPVLVYPGQAITLSLAFAPAESWPPLERKGTLEIRSNDPERRRASVQVVGRIRSECTLTVSPPSIDFGRVALDATVSAVVRITSTGKAACAVAGIGLAPGSDAQFSLDPGTTAALTLPPGGQRELTVRFHAVEHSRPHRRTADLLFQTTDPGHEDVRVPLSAEIDVGCWLTWTPAALDFGTLILNTAVTRALTLGNEGTAPCQVSGIALAADTASGFALAAGQAASLTVSPDGQASMSVRFEATDSAPPHDKTGTLVFATGNPRAPQAKVPLSALIDTTCEEAGRWIYTVSSDGILSKFDPEALTFTDIARLDCPIAAGPNSMAVDQHGFAWVAYGDGSLFKVDITNGKCEATSFKPNQHGLHLFGMGFVFDPSTGIDTLYIAGGKEIVADESTLATLAFPSLVVTPVGTIAAGFPELTGTGDGELWGFIPQIVSTSSDTVLARFDPTNGQTLERHTYPSLGERGGWAVRFWGGYFWLFLNNSIYRLPRDAMDDDDLETMIGDTGRTIVGVGVSTCAPLKKT